MRIDLNTHFPHPVLCEGNGDFGEGSFELSIPQVREIPGGDVEIDYVLTLTEPSLSELFESEEISAGAFVRCQDTFCSELRAVSGLTGTWRFERSALYGKVEVKPLLWVRKAVSSWSSPNLNSEFGASVSLRDAEIVGLAQDIVFSIGMDKLKKFESIFEMERADSVAEGQIQINLLESVIKIQVPSDLYDSIEKMRGTKGWRPILLGAVYLPAIMEVLDNLRENSGFEDSAWHRVFSAKCDHFAIDLDNPRLLESAQKLLGSPIGRLDKSFQELTENA